MENQRIRISKTMLKQALLELLQKKSIHKISVSELCSHAQINRTTFYKYYGNPSDVLVEIEQDIIHELEESLQTYDGSSQHLYHIFEFLYEHRHPVTILLHNIPDSQLTEVLFRLPSVKALLLPQISSDYSSSEREFIYLYICQGCYAVIQKWLYEDCPASARTIADFLHKLAKENLL